MAAQGGGSGASGGSPSSEADLARRRDRLSRELEAERQEQVAAERTQDSAATGYGAGLRLASEFVAGVLVGAAIGWAVDRFAGTSPWGLIGFLLLGFAAGVLNAIRAAGRTSQPVAGTAERGDETPAQGSRSRR